MYNINRQEASEILWISTRSIDRYIKSWKIRSKKDGKIVMLNDSDINNLNWWVQTKQKIIINTEPNQKLSNDNEVSINSNSNKGLVKKEEYEKILSTFDNMFSSFREEIKDKDNKIQELSVELWRSREQKNNSIDLMEYKKSQFLSEEAKKGLSNSLEKEKKEKENVNKQLKYEKNTNKLLILFIVILFIVWIVFFFMNI